MKGITDCDQQSAEFFQFGKRSDVPVAICQLPICQFCLFGKGLTQQSKNINCQLWNSIYHDDSVENIRLLFQIGKNSVQTARWEIIKQALLDTKFKTSISLAKSVLWWSSGLRGWRSGFKSWGMF